MLWLAASGLAAYLIHPFVEPTFEAVSLLRAEPARGTIFDHQIARVTRDRKTSGRICRPRCS